MGGIKKQIERMTGERIYPPGTHLPRVRIYGHIYEATVFHVLWKPDGVWYLSLEYDQLFRFRDILD